VLSEQLLFKSSSMGEPSLGFANDIVCFSFQHAPKGALVSAKLWPNLTSTDILEQAGISWPIRNPLYCLDANERSLTSSKVTESSSRAARFRNNTEDTQIHSPLSRTSASNFMRPRNPEPFRRPNSHPPLPHLPGPPFDGRGNGHPNIWDDSFRAYRDSHDDESQSSWSTQKSASNSTSTGEMFLGGCKPPSSRRFQPTLPLATPPTMFQDITQSEWPTSRQRRNQDRPSTPGLTLQDDHFIQTAQASSPPKRHRDFPHGIDAQLHGHISRPPTLHALHPPKMGNIAPTSRPTAAALARKLSYQNCAEIIRNAPRKLSPDKHLAIDYQKNRPFPAYHPSVSSNKENSPPPQSQLSTLSQYANRVPRPDPLNPKLTDWNSDVSMRDGSSVFSSFNRYNGGEAQAPSYGTSHAPPSTGGIRSRKEAPAQVSPYLPDHESRHDQSMLPSTLRPRDSTRETVNMFHASPTDESSKVIEIIDVDAIDAIDPVLDSDAPLDLTKLSSFKPSHKPAASSMDSTGRIERTLFSALGEELGTFDTHAIESHMVDTVLDPTASEFESVGKRKRQGTPGGDRGGSPASKKERGGNGDEVE
jgi:hypothetical protein